MTAVQLALMQQRIALFAAMQTLKDDDLQTFRTLIADVVSCFDPPLDVARERSKS